MKEFFSLRILYPQLKIIRILSSFLLGDPHPRRFEHLLGEVRSGLTWIRGEGTNDKHNDDRNTPRQHKVFNECRDVHYSLPEQFYYTARGNCPFLYSVRYNKVQMPPGSADFVHRRCKASSDNPRLAGLRRFRKGILRLFQRMRIDRQAVKSAKG
jgi:hypothetical protein